MIQSDRFSTGKNDLLLLERGSRRERAAAFLEPFGVDPEKGGVFLDASGHPLALTPAWIDGLDDHGRDELAAAAASIARADEIRLVWKRAADGEQLLTRRYIARVGDLDVAADVNKSGWAFATSRNSGFRLDRLRVGEPIFPV